MQVNMDTMVIDLNRDIFGYWHNGQSIYKDTTLALAVSIWLMRNFGYIMPLKMRIVVFRLNYKNKLRLVKKQLLTKL